MRSLVVASLIVAVSLVAAACGPSGTPAGSSPATATGTVPTPLAPSGRGETPAPEAVPTVDTSRHSVPLEDIHFDTFDGSSVALADASPETILRLRDAIPPLDRPRYDGPEGGRWLEGDDLVIGFVADDGAAYAYPLKILNFHEFVNDEFAGRPVLISYCPLCLSGVAYSRELDGRVFSFGNTSALYQSNAVMFDRQTGSYWVQVSGEAIVGALTGARLTPLPSSTMSWQDWLALHPETRVLSRETGHRRPYERDVFAGYAEAVNRGRFPFPVSDRVRREQRLRPAEVVLAVIAGGRERAYPLGLLGDVAVNDRLGDVPTVVFTSQAGPAGSAFEARVEEQELTFRFQGGRYVDDQTGSTWDLAGRAVGGPLEGSALPPLPSRTSFWFSIVATLPEIELYQP